MIRKVYCHDGEQIELRMIEDRDAEKNATSWKEQLRPGSLLIQTHTDGSISVCDPNPSVVKRPVFLDSEKNPKGIQDEVVED